MPGGGVEPEEEPRNTAIREVEEEAGVIGKLGRCLGVFEVRVRILPHVLGMGSLLCVHGGGRNAETILTFNITRDPNENFPNILLSF